MEVKLVVIVIIAIISGAIGAGISYSVLNPMIVNLQNEISTISVELATVSDELATISDEVDTITDELDNLSSIGDVSTIVSTITEIEARTWNLVYTNSNVVNLMSPAGWFNTSTFTIQGKLMRIDWKLWCDTAGLTTFDIELHYANGTLVDTVGSQIDTIRSTTVASEREYSTSPGDYYLRLRVREGSGSEHYEVNVGDYF
jgi:hypothetical protein